MLKNGQEYFHYDVPVYVYNYYPETDEERLSLLKKCGNGSFIELPYVNLEIYKQKFSTCEQYIILNEKRNRIYRTSQFPVDGNWELLIADMMKQEDGDIPSLRTTRLAKVLFEIDDIMYGQPSFWEDARTPPDFQEIANYLKISYGFSKERVSMMEHYDIDEGYFQKILDCM